MQAERPPARRYGRWQALWFGLPLGALLVGLYQVATLPPFRLSTGQALLVGGALYLIIPLFAGYRYCYQRRHEGWQSGWAGFRVGLVAAMLFLLVMGVIFGIVVYIDGVSPPPPSSPPSRIPHSHSLVILFSVIIVGLLALLNSVGVLLSAMGGRLGGALAIWRTAPRGIPTENAGRAS
jgi:hypothetical protein